MSTKSSHRPTGAVATPSGASGSESLRRAISSPLSGRPLLGRRFVSLYIRDEPYATLVRKIRVAPLQQHTEPVAKSDQIHDVDEEPKKPRQAPGELHLAEVGDRA